MQDWQGRPWRRPRGRCCVHSRPGGLLSPISFPRLVGSGYQTPIAAYTVLIRCVSSGPFPQTAPNAALGLDCAGYSSDGPARRSSDRHHQYYQMPIGRIKVFIILQAVGERCPLPSRLGRADVTMALDGYRELGTEHYLYSS